ncbi:hypothetical protein F4778DRAFT_773921 [Xylariomycetidae sp. FL2044]|nr:hypothetical protein F4778DRAFT_773921 [Xylariomycetidae sp. FL2044]
MVLRKKEVYTVITPIPGFIPRQLAIDILHSHEEVITLNPLVLGHKQIKAPRDAAADEYFSTWYEITERIQIMPGVGKLGSSKITFNGCFHDLPWGLQTHIYAPLNIDMRNKYRIGGNQPGVEPPEQTEIGLAALGAPKDGLYLREDIEFKCNITMVGVVKSQMKAASKEMVSRIIKKAELLDAGTLQAMIENGRMKTFNPNDKTYTGGLSAAAPSPPMSPGSPYNQPPMSPTAVPYQVPRPMSMQYQHQQRPSTASSLGYPAHWQAQQQQLAAGEQKGHQHFAELHNSPTSAPGPAPAIVMELPGDFYHSQPPHPLQPSPHLNPPQPSPSKLPYGRQSPASIQSASPDPNSGGGGWRWSQGQPSPNPSSRPTSYTSDGSSSAGFASPGLDHKGFAAELPTHRETQEEHRQGPANPGPPPPPKMAYPYPYNPGDYAQVRR